MIAETPAAKRDMTLSYGPFVAATAFVEVLAGKRSIGPADRGQHVKTLEQTLVMLGYGLPGGATPDVAYTAGTKSTLTRFQRDKGLPQSGVLDKATLEALDRAAASKRPAGALAGAGGGGPAAARPNTIQLMQQLFAEAREGGGAGGSRITREEVERALGALALDDASVSPDEHAAAQREVASESFQRLATPDAKAFAAEFLRKHAPSAEAIEPALKIRKLDPAARDAALGGKSKLTAEIQAAEVKISPPVPAGATDADGLASLAKRAFGRGGLAIQAFEAREPFDLEQLLARGVAGYNRPQSGEVRGVLGALVRAASGGRLLAADWARGKEEQGTHVAAVGPVGPGGADVLLLDVFRVG